MSESSSDTALYVEAAAARVGELLDGRYRLRAVIGSGGVGVVYHAIDEANGGPVAIKVLHEQFGLVGASRSRFEREGKVLQKLTHPNIVELRSFGVSDGLPFLVMELLRGRTLYQALREGALPVEVAVGVAGEILDALAFAHELGIVHRDLKPGNIFLSEGPQGERVKILDFGLAKLLHDESSGDGETLTRSGMVLGTPQYMPPEQGTGDRVDERADVYAVGCVLYEMVAGRPPFERDSQVELIRAHLLDPPPPLPRREEMGDRREELDVIISRAMAKDPGQRFPGADEMSEALRSLGTGRLTAARRARRGLGWVLAAMGLWLVVGLWWSYRGQPDSAPAIGETGSVDPWTRDGVPSELTGIRDRVLTGEPLDRDEIGDLQAFIRLHPEDPRPLLLMAHGFVNKQWYRDALDRYARAVELDPSARRDPRMLDGLLTIVSSSGKYDARATDFVVEHFGAEAAGPVADALSRAQGVEQLRLERLQARLR